MTYAVRVSNSILINQNGDVELHSNDEIIKALRETLVLMMGKERCSLVNLNQSSFLKLMIHAASIRSIV